MIRLDLSGGPANFRLYTILFVKEKCKSWNSIRSDDSIENTLGVASPCVVVAFVLFFFRAVLDACMYYLIFSPLRRWRRGFCVPTRRLLVRWFPRGYRITPPLCFRVSFKRLTGDFALDRARVAAGTCDALFHHVRSRFLRVGEPPPQRMRCRETSFRECIAVECAAIGRHQGRSRSPNPRCDRAAWLFNSIPRCRLHCCGKRGLCVSIGTCVDRSAFIDATRATKRVSVLTSAASG